jgi:hypothetical protein
MKITTIKYLLEGIQEVDLEVPAEEEVGAEVAHLQEVEEEAVNLNPLKIMRLSQINNILSSNKTPLLNSIMKVVANSINNKISTMINMVLNIILNSIIMKKCLNNNTRINTHRTKITNSISKISIINRLATPILHNTNRNQVVMSLNNNRKVSKKIKVTEELSILDQANKKKKRKNLILIFNLIPSSHRANLQSNNPQLNHLKDIANIKLSLISSMTNMINSIKQKIPIHNLRLNINQSLIKIMMINMSKNNLSFKLRDSHLEVRYLINMKLKEIIMNNMAMNLVKKIELMTTTEKKVLMTL